jgi:hypothetical protein
MTMDQRIPDDRIPDEAFTPRHIKDAALELLKYGLLESASKPNLYRAAVAGNRDIARILEPLDLLMNIDELRGIAYVAVAETAAAETEDEWSHPLVRRQRMNLEQSLLVAILRQQFVVHEQEAGLGASAATVAVEDLLPHLQMYLGNLGSDAQEQKRLRGLLEQLKGYGLVSEVDAHDQCQIRPIIAHLANPANLTNLLHAFRNASHPAPAPSPSPDADES